MFGMNRIRDQIVQQVAARQQAPAPATTVMPAQPAALAGVTPRTSWGRPRPAPVNLGWGDPTGGREPGGIVGPPKLSTDTPAPSAASPFDLQKFRSGWESGAAGFSPGDLKKYVGGFHGVTMNPGGKGDKVRLPNGQLVDMIFSTGSPQARAQWLPVEAGGSGGAAAAAAGATNFSMSGGSPYGVESGPGGDIFKLLMQRAKQGLAVDPNDPVIKNQVDAFRATQTNQAREYMADQAERAGPNANIGAEGRLASERVGQATSGMQAELMGREVTARRQEIENALSGAAGFLTNQQRMQLEQELEHLRLAQNQSQFGRQLGEQSREFDVNDVFRHSPLYGG